MSSAASEEGRLQSFTIDQAAGAFALALGALGSLLLVVWQSRCLCRCRIGCSDTCYIFDCSREPPPGDDEEIKNIKKKEDEILEKEEEILEEVIIPPKTKGDDLPYPEPEIERP